MNLIAHITSLESTAAIVVFLAGAGTGMLIAHFAYAWIKERLS
jgi:hypothetical protein